MKVRELIERLRGLLEDAEVFLLHGGEPFINPDNLEVQVTQGIARVRDDRGQIQLSATYQVNLVPKAS